jgi:hypothetical protein
VANIPIEPITYIILSEQVERAEELVVVQIEGPCGLEIALECDNAGSFDDKLLRSAHLTELLLVLGCQARRPPRSAAMVRVRRVGVEVRRVVLPVVAEELRHDGTMLAMDGWRRGMVMLMLMVVVR